MAYQDRNGETLGGALREWREASDMTLGAVSQVTGAPITRLVDIENDKIGPSGQLLMKLAGLYLDECKGCRSEAGWYAMLTWLQVFGNLDSPTNREMLDVVASSIRRMRSLPDDGLVIMRDQEADIVFSMLDIEDEELENDVIASFGYQQPAAAEFLERVTARQARRGSPRQPIIDRIGTRTGIDSSQDAA